VGLISSLVCEHDLPIPFSDFGEDEKRDFKDIKWDELLFYTSSFFDASENHYGVSTYTISEDGQFYKNEVDMKFVENKSGEIVTKEVDNGIEKLDFTGEIYFGTEIFGESHDYTITFKALFFKGEMKGLEADEWTKKCNEKRKMRSADLAKEFAKQNEARDKLWYKLTYPVKWVALGLIDLAGWFVAKTFKGLVRIRQWITHE
jgi:hypothetical protein